MLSFINYLLMIEAKVDDLAAKHPEHADAIRKYSAADPTPTKKFLPWLVKQHISGHVTPDDARLGSTLQHFDKVKHSLDTKDHSSYHYNDLATAVGDRVKSKMEQEGKKNAVETIHTQPNGITAQHIKTKEASQDLYGGGNERGGKKGCARGTSWCVSARSEGNQFHNYGHMYTIHAPNDDNAPYAVHPFNRRGTTTSRHNDGDISHEEVVKKNPHLKGAVDAIMNHSAKHIDAALGDTSPDVRARAIQHPKATPEHITKALNDKSEDVRTASIQHPKATPEHITKALNDEDAWVRASAIEHPKATPEHITKALSFSGEDNKWIRKQAIRHPNATTKHITKALNDEDQGVREAAIQHPKATPEHITKALSLSGYDNRWIRKQAIKHPKATPEHITKALNDEDQGVREAAIEHPKATPEHITKALSLSGYDNKWVRISAIRHPKATPEHITKALNDDSQFVRNIAWDANRKRERGQ
jgi:HEAT repeat protein